MSMWIYSNDSGVQGIRSDISEQQIQEYAEKYTYAIYFFAELISE